MIFCRYMSGVNDVCQPDLGLSKGCWRKARILTLFLSWLHQYMVLYDMNLFQARLCKDATSAQADACLQLLVVGCR